MKLILRVQAPIGHSYRWLASYQNISLARATPEAAASITRACADAIAAKNEALR